MFYMSQNNIMRQNSILRTFIQNFQFQGIELRGCETYWTYGEHHLNVDNAGIGYFEACSKLFGQD